MAKRTTKRNQAKAFSGNHQRSWLWGHHAVLETIQAGRWPILELYATSAAYAHSSELLDACAEQGVRLEMVSSERLEELSRSSEHQGLVARLGSFPYGDVESLLADLKGQLADQRGGDGQGTRMPLVVMCDRLQDSFNMGAILRCCDGTQTTAVIVGEREQAAMTPHVVRASSGAVNHLRIVRSGDLLETAHQLQQLGMELVAADSNATASLWGARLTVPLVLIIGSEAHGVAPELLALCGQRLSIPMLGQVSSLNAAVAAGILLYEIRRQGGQA